MDRRDYAAAAPLLRKALIRHPTDLDTHYRLGVSASHLDQVDEAGREFEWVVAHVRRNGMSEDEATARAHSRLKMEEMTEPANNKINNYRMKNQRC